MVSVSLQNNCIEDSLRLQFNSNDGQQELSLGLLILFWFYYKIFCSCLGFIFNFNFIFHAFKVVNICIQQIKYKNLYKNIDFNIMISNMQLWGMQKKKIKKKKQIFLLAILRNVVCHSDATWLPESLQLASIFGAFLFRPTSDDNLLQTTTQIT